MYSLFGAKCIKITFQAVCVCVRVIACVGPLDWTVASDMNEQPPVVFSLRRRLAAEESGNTVNMTDICNNVMFYCTKQKLFIRSGENTVE